MENFGPFTPRSYFRRALFDQHNVILMLGAVLLALAFASFAPLLIGVCAEVLFLVVSPRLQAFRDWADRQDSAARQLSVRRSLSAELAGLGFGLGARFDALALLLDDVVARIVAQRGLSLAELEVLREHFEQLLRSSLGLMQTQQGVLLSIAEIPSIELSQEVKRLEQAFAAQRDLELRMGLRQQLLAAQKRLAQGEDLEKTSAKLELELRALENSVGYLRSRSAELLRSGQMLNEVRSLLFEVAPSSRREGPAHGPSSTAATLSAPPGLVR